MIKTAQCCVTADDNDDWGTIELGKPASSSSTDKLPHTEAASSVHTSGGTKVKNDPDMMKKTKAKVLKSVTDMSNAKMQIKQCLIEVKDTPAGQILKDKVDGVPEKIDGWMKEWEDFSDWQYADLGAIKKMWESDR